MSSSGSTPSTPSSHEPNTPSTSSFTRSSGSKRRVIQKHLARKQKREIDEGTELIELEKGETTPDGKKFIYAQLLHVQPLDGAATGYGVRVFGYGEKGMTDPLFNRNNGKPHNLEFIDTIECVQKVFQHFKANQPVKNRGGYQVKILLFPCDATATEAQLREGFELNFAPAYINVCNDNQFWSKEMPEDVILAPKHGYKTFSSWDQVVAPNEVVEAIQGITRKMADNYFATGMNQVYSAWRQGFVPEAMIKKFNLTEQHLLPPDIEKLQPRDLGADLKAAVATKAAARNAGNPEEDNCL